MYIIHYEIDLQYTVELGTQQTTIYLCVCVYVCVCMRVCVREYGLLCSTVGLFVEMFKEDGYYGCLNGSCVQERAPWCSSSWRIWE